MVVTFFLRAVYLRSTMGQDHLNNLMLLHVHKEATDKLDLIARANDLLVTIVIGTIYLGSS